MEITGSLFLSLNFESGVLPSSIELIPAGTLIQGRDGRKWKNSRPQEVALNSMARLPRLVVDENHATDLAAPKGGSSPAMGWMTNLRTGQGGSIWADVAWTKRGEQAVLNREYSFISPVFQHNEQGEITTVLRAALTNSPNLQLPALNSEQSSVEQSLSEKPESINQEESMNKELCAALCLSETAAEAEVLAAVQALQSKVALQSKAALNAADPDTSRVDLAAYAPRADLNAMEARALAVEKQLAELNATGLKREAEAAVDEAIKNRKIAPASRTEYLALCSSQEGLETFKKIAAATPAIIGEGTQAPEGTPPSEGSGVALNAEEVATYKAMGYTEEEIGKIKEGKK